MVPPCRLARVARASGDARLAQTFLPQRFEHVGERFGQVSAGLPNAPSIAGERRSGEIIERDERRLQQMLETQVEIVRHRAERGLLLPPVQRRAWRADGDTRP